MKKIFLFFGLILSIAIFGQKTSELDDITNVTDSTMWKAEWGAAQSTKKVTALQIWNYTTAKYSANKFQYNTTTHKLGLNTWNTDPLHGLVLLADSGIATGGALTWKYIYNISDPNFNKNRSTVAQATDTLSYSIWITNSGKWHIKQTDKTGATIYMMDTLGNVGVGGAPSATYKLAVTGSSYSSTSVNAGGAVVATTTIDSYGNNFRGMVGLPLYLQFLSASTTNTSYDVYIIGQTCKTTTANLNGGNNHAQTGSSTGSGSAYFEVSTSGGGLTGGTSYLAATSKFKIGGIGELIYTPRSTTQTGADSLTIKITMSPGATVSNMGARVIDVTTRKNITITGITIDTVGATPGQEILIRNASPNGKTFSIADTAGSSVLFNAGPARLVFTPGSNIYMTCQKINNMTFWVEISHSIVTYRKP